LTFLDISHKTWLFTLEHGASLCESRHLAGIPLPSQGILEKNLEIPSLPDTYNSAMLLCSASWGAFYGWRGGRGEMWQS
jgi:hypothetical protein